MENATRNARWASACTVTLLLGILIPMGSPTADGQAPAEGALRIEHQVPVGDGVSLHVVERVPAEPPAEPKAILFFPATLVTHRFWDADVTDDAEYNGLLRATERGYHAYTFDYEGYGASTRPADGSIVTAERILAQAGALAEWILARTGAAELDLMGASLGGSIAFALGGTDSPIDAGRIGEIGVVTFLYKDAYPTAQATVIGPAFCFLFANSPDGYIDTAPPTYAPFLLRSDPAAIQWALDAFPGTYAAGPTMEGCDLPVFEASAGRAPLKLFWGTLDTLQPQTDAERFVAEYGGPATLHVLDTGSHSPMFEPVRHQMWAETWEWLDD